MSKCAVCGEMKEDIIISSLDFVPKCKDCLRKSGEIIDKIMLSIFENSEDEDGDV